MKITDIKREYNSLGPDEYRTFIDRYESDERAGVVKIVMAAKRALERQNKLKERYKTLLSFDAVHSNNTTLIGVDEAGRGPLFGPVVAAAVVIEPCDELVQVYDSKTLSEDLREHLYDVIIEKAVSYGVGVVSAKEIDEIGILNATKKAMREAVSQIDVTTELVLVDYVDIEFAGKRTVAVVKGDAKSFSIAAASIIAKVHRDRMIREMASTLPDYDLLSNKGYGTKRHYELIEQNGISREHRRSFLKNL